MTEESEADEKPSNQLLFPFGEDGPKATPESALPLSNADACLRTLPATRWCHPGCARDRVTLAIMCGCEGCNRLLFPMVDYSAWRKVNG